MRWQLVVAILLRAGLARAAPSVFDDGFSFQCSPLAEVGCRGVFPVRRGGAPELPTEVAVPFGGEDALRARIAVLRGARRSVRVQALIFRADETGLLVAGLLKEKRRAGLDVRVIVDAASNLDWRTQWMYFDLKRHGIDVEGYEALYLEWATADVKARDPLRANKRFHDKMWIVDGEEPDGVAVVGGRNVANEYFRMGESAEHHWLDQDLLVRGPLVRDAVLAFDRNYDYFKGLKQRLPGTFNPDNAWHLSRPALALIGRVKLPDWSRPALTQLVAHTVSTAAPVEYRKVVARFVQSRPRLEERLIRQTYLDLIARARRSILIANAYFIPPRQLSDGLRDAARRGVQVVILTNSPATNDIAAVAAVSRFAYRDLLEVNAEEAVRKSGGSLAIHEWVGARFGDGTLHAKYALFDGEEAIVGSYNLDPRSERLNSETVLALRDPAIVSALVAEYRDTILPRSRRVEPAEAETYHRPPDVPDTFKLLYALPIKDWL